MAYRDVVLADSPLWFLEFNETTGQFTNAGSAVGTTSSVGAGVTRNAGGAASIGGQHVTFAKGVTTSRITVPAGNAWLSDITFTLEAWVKTTATTNSTITQYNGAHYYVLQMDLNGKVNFQFATNVSINLTSTKAINDGAWHHVAVVMNAGTATIYIDGVADGSATATFAAFTSNVDFEIGNASSTGTWAGDIDELAVYDAALTGTRLAAHHSAGTATNASHTASALTASATMPGGNAVIPVDKTVSAAAMTASATFPGGVAATKKATRYAVRDTYVESANPDTNYGTSTLLYVHGGKIALWGVDLNLPNDAQIGRAELVLYPSTGEASTYNITAASIDGAWSETTTWNTRPTTGGVAGQTKTAANGMVLNVTDVVKAMQAGTAHGIAITSNATASTYVRARENTTSLPYLEVTYASSGNVTTVVVPLTANAAITEPSVTAGKSVTVAVGAATATATLTGASVEATDTVAFNAAAMTASAAMPTAVLPHRSLAAVALTANAAMPTAAVVAGTSRTVAVAPFTASAATAAGVFSNTTNRQIYPLAMAATARWVGVYSEANDPYLVRLTAQTKSAEDYWLRLDETSGTDVLNNVTGAVIGQFIGPVEFNVPAPLTRKAIGFRGDSWIDMDSANQATVVADVEATVELVFRTTKANQVIAKGYGATSGTSPLINILSMTDGRLVVRPGGFSPTKRLDDGEWHHITVSYRPDANGTVLEIMVDRNLVMRRYTDQFLLNEFDSIGKGDTTTDWFEGDIMEFVQRSDHSLSLKDAVRNSYAVFGDTVIEEPRMTATAGMPAAKARGNQKRALMLYFNYEDERFAGGTYRHGQADDYPWSGIFGTEQVRPAGNYSSGQLRDVPDDVSFDLFDYKVFKRSVRTRPAPIKYGDTTTVAYFDEVTGEQGFIDLRNDIAVADYDLLFFADLPPRDYFGGKAYENLIEGVRWAVDQGVSLWCPQPQLAVDLGLVDGVDWHSLMREQSDERSLAIEHPSFLAEFPMTTPAWYTDTHYLNKYRIVNAVEGLTTWGGWDIEEAVKWTNLYMPMGPKPDYVKERHREVPNGLAIGDQFTIPTDIFNVRGSGSGQLVRDLRYSIVGIPADRWHAGVPVAKEQPTVTMGNSELPNPYADWTLAFVVRPGDNVKGRPVGGKIFVNFMEGANREMWLVRQQFDPNAPDAYDGWDWDSRRFVTFFNWILVRFTQTLNGEKSFKEISVPQFEQYDKYAAFYDRRHYSMAERGLLWLGQRDDVEPGTKRVYTTAATATATMPAPTVSAQRSTTVNAQPALATARLVKPEGIPDTDVAQLALPATATATFGALQRIISPTPMTATASMPDVMPTVGGEHVVVYLRQFTPTVYLKEEA